MSAVKALSDKKVTRRRILSMMRRILFYVVVVAVVALWVSVFVWMALSSLKTQAEIFATPPSWLFKPNLKNYSLVFAEQDFFRFLYNSFIIGVVSTLIGLLLGLPAAYSIARYRQKKVAFTILAARVMPGVAYLLPLFLLFRTIGLSGTRMGIVLSHVVVTFPLTVWVMIGFFEDVPSELIECALIDGSSRMGAFVRIALPIAQPGIVATSILSLIFSWNDYKFALVLSNQKSRTLPVAVTSWRGFASIEWGAIMAEATMIVVPILMLSLFIQRYIVSGLTVGALKG